MTTQYKKLYEKCTKCNGHGWVEETCSKFPLWGLVEGMPDPQMDCSHKCNCEKGWNTVYIKEIT